MRIAPKTGKNNEFHIGFVGELNHHFLFDIKIFLTPNDRHGHCELVHIGLKIVLVPSEVCLVMIEGVRRSYVVLAPSSQYVISEFLRNFELLILGQPSSKRIFQNFIASAIHVGTSAVRRRLGFQALQAGIHVLGPVKRGEITNNHFFAKFGSSKARIRAGKAPISVA
jgi:hypothetical protein